jgi:hypothetical protein
MLGNTPSVETAPGKLDSKASHISAGSTLKAGDDRSKVLSDIERFIDPVEHIINQAAKQYSMHYVHDCKSIYTRTSTDIRILLIENQQWILKNESSSPITVSSFSIGPGGKQQMRGTKTVSPGSVLHVHAM